MPTQVTRNETHVTLIHQGELTIYAAAELKAILGDALVECTRLEIDLSGVCEIDAAGLQLLFAAKRELESKGGSLGLAGAGDALRAVFELCNLNGHFGAAARAPLPRSGP